MTYTVSRRPGVRTLLVFGGMCKGLQGLRVGRGRDEEFLVIYAESGHFTLTFLLSKKFTISSSFCLWDFSLIGVYTVLTSLDLCV